MDDPPALERAALSRYVVRWVVIGGTAGVVLAVRLLAERPEPDRWALVGVVALVALLSSLPLRLHLGRRSLTLDLTEASVVVAVVVIPLAWVGPAVLTGSALSLLAVRRVDRQRLGFNLGVIATSLLVVVVVLDLVGVDRLVIDDPVHLLALIVGLGGYVLVNTAATLGLWRRLSMVLPSGRAGLLGATAFGTSVAVCLAVVAVGLIATVPVLLPFLVALVVIVGASLRQGMEHLDTELRGHERLERVVAGASDGIGLLDDRGRLELANPAMRALLRIDQELEGHRLADVLADLPAPSQVPPTRTTTGPQPLSPAEAAAALRAWLTRPDRERPQRRIDVVTGEAVLALELTASAGPGDVPAGVVVLAYDVTAAREAEALRADLVARVSHELRTPLTSIIGFVEVLEHRDDLEGADRATYLAIVARQARRLQRLVGTLLWSARIDAGLGGQTRPSDIHLATLVRDTLDALPPAGPEGAELVDIPDGVTARADVDHVTQIVENLVLNARTYGAPPVWVEAAVDPRDDAQVVLTVSDAGPGIPASFERALWAPFEQASSGDRRTATGLGLGLSIVRALAHGNDGEVRFVRRDARSRFEVRLPRGGAVDRSGGDPGGR
ncbi:MAG: PAS domain-containing sensor histidine kinase [Nitriliruptoraceae bacterium]|nr:PAS domain-containing sensor histidine kinase [Nitriliruptoraceae bacterium]